ncbi:hypothetical protein J6590_057695 [Homalodisca vitripennis]|nr:hypothetical protein J6590_057695 [Homalodisca vitripennis]
MAPVIIATSDISSYFPIGLIGLDTTDYGTVSPCRHKRDSWMYFENTKLEPTTAHSKNRCATSIWATLWMSSSGTSLTANVEILGFKGNSIEALVNLNKGVPPPAYFDWRGWFTAGLPFFRDDFEM